MSGLDAVYAHLDDLRDRDASDSDHTYDLQNHVVEAWIKAVGLSRRQVLDVVSAWIAFGFDAGRLTFEFADMIVNNLHVIAQIQAPPGLITDFHTPLSWEVYLAFEDGEFSEQSNLVTHQLITDILERIAVLTEYKPALDAFTRAEPAATS